VRGKAPTEPAGRLEYKFMVHKELIDELRTAMMPHVRLDEFSERRPEKQYTVRSVYYDNRRFDCYYEKFDGFRLKKKLRIRGYDTPQPDSIVFLEIKRRYEDFISKHRAPLRWDQIGSVFAGHGPKAGPLPFKPGSAAAEAASRFLYNYYRRRMRPTALTAYEREAFFGRFDPKLRITFDKNIRSRLYPSLDSLYCDRDTKFLIPGHFILEVKFYLNLPAWVRSWLTRFSLERRAFSKYATGVEVHRLERKFQRGVAHWAEFPSPPRTAPRLES
jgi:hypothetical protein